MNCSKEAKRLGFSDEQIYGIMKDGTDEELYEKEKNRAPRGI